MIAPRSLQERLSEGRLTALLPAIESTLKTHFPGVEVRSLAGKIDMSDVLEGAVIQPPAIAVALVRWRAPGDVGARCPLDLDLAAYVITEETVLAARSERREVVAWAISEGLLEILADLDVARWGMKAITSPDAAEARPLFTAETYARGTAYYAVTWKQRLLPSAEGPLERMAYSEVESVQDGDIITWPLDMSEAPV